MIEVSNLADSNGDGTIDADDLSFTTSGGVLTISTERGPAEGEVTLRVTDTGVVLRREQEAEADVVQASSRELRRCVRQHEPPALERHRRQLDVDGLAGPDTNEVGGRVPGFRDG